MEQAHHRAKSPLPQAAGDGSGRRGAAVGRVDEESAPLMIEMGAAEFEPPLDTAITALLFLFPALAGLLFGYDIGATSGALVSLASPQHSGTDWYALTPLQSGLVVSLSLAGALLGSVAALLFGDRLGRKNELVGAAALYGCSSLLLALAPTLPVVLLARLVYGCGIGLAMHAAPAYIAETSPAQVRGLLISLKEVFIVAGILAGYIASYVFVQWDGGWRFMYGAAALPAVVLAAGMAWLPESPRWLMLSGAGPGAAAQALRRAKGTAASEAAIVRELDAMQAAMADSSLAKPPGGMLGLGELLEPRYRRPLAAGVSLMLFQQITGQPSVLYYAATTFEAAGFSGAGAATQAPLALGLFKLLMTCIAVATVDSWGRRPLLLTGVTGIIAALLVLGVVGADVLPVAEGAAAWANLGALLLYVGSYQISFGPISWLLVGEVFPLRVRGQAIALATMTNFASNFAVSLALPSVQGTVGPAATYFGFAAVGAVALWTIHRIVPETRGRTLEEIEVLWGPAAGDSTARWDGDNARAGLPPRQQSHSD